MMVFDLFVAPFAGCSFGYGLSVRACLDIQQKGVLVFV